MSIFIYILINNILPIFILIGLGYFLSQKFEFDIFTLSKLNFYLFVPSFIFVNLYSTVLDITMFKIAFFYIIYLALNDFMARLIGRLRGYDVALINAIKNAVVFSNTGNIGLSLIILVFSTGNFVMGGTTPYLLEAQTILIIALVINNVTTNTIGFYNAGRATMSFKHSLKKILTMPSIYAIPLAFLLKSTTIDVTSLFIWPALIYMKNSLVATALITLGVQLSKTKIEFRDMKVYLTVVVRLVVGPILALALIAVFGFTGIIAQVLFIISALPPAVNTALIAVEFENHANFATQTVVVATLFSAITLTFTIYFAQIHFPIV
jgi:hypothetical protein